MHASICAVLCGVMRCCAVLLCSAIMFCAVLCRPCCVVQRSAGQHGAVQCGAVPCRAMQCSAVPCSAALCDAIAIAIAVLCRCAVPCMPCHPAPCRATLRHTMPHHAAPCSAVWRRVVPSCVLLFMPCITVQCRRDAVHCLAVPCSAAQR